MPLMLPSSTSVPPSPFSFVLSKMDIVRYCIGTFRTVQQLEKKRKLHNFSPKLYNVFPSVPKLYNVFFCLFFLGKPVPLMFWVSMFINVSSVVEF